MNDKLIKTIVLGNGLIVEIYDPSRKIAVNRWLVKMVAKIDISIDRPALSDGLNKRVNLNSPKETFDNFVRYEQKKERNFIAEKEKDTVFDDLVTSFLKSTRKYLSHPNFAARCVVREHLRQQQRKTWYSDGNKA